MHAHTAEDTLAERCHHFVVVLDFGAHKAAESSAVFFGDNHVMRNVHKTTSQVTGVGSLKSRVGKTLTGTVRGDEVLEHAEAFFEVGENRVFDNLTAFRTGLLRFGHKATHAGELANLVFRTTGAGVEHHEHRVEALVGLGHLLHEHFGESAVHVCPDVDNLVVTLGIGDKAHGIVVHHFLHLLVAFVDDLFLFGGDYDVAEVEAQTAAECHVVAEVLDVVKELG